MDCWNSLLKIIANWQTSVLLLYISDGNNWRMQLKFISADIYRSCFGILRTERASRIF